MLIAHFHHLSVDCSVPGGKYLCRTTSRINAQLATVAFVAVVAESLGREADYSPNS